MSILISIVSFAGEELEVWIQEGKPIVDLRFRLESVDQDGFDKDALASTIGACI